MRRNGILKQKDINPKRGREEAKSYAEKKMYSHHCIKQIISTMKLNVNGQIEKKQYSTLGFRRKPV